MWRNFFGVLVCWALIYPTYVCGRAYARRAQ